MSLHEDARAVLTAWAAPDAGQEELRTSYLAHLESHDDAMWRTCLPGHLTASAAILSADGSRVALVLHRIHRMWLQTGGHCEGHDTTMVGAALREATEESGIAGITVLPEPVRLDRHSVPCGGGSLHLDVQFAAVAPDDAVLVPGHGPTRTHRRLGARPGRRRGRRREGVRPRPPLRPTHPRGRDMSLFTIVALAGGLVAHLFYRRLRMAARELLFDERAGRVGTREAARIRYGHTRRSFRAAQLVCAFLALLLLAVTGRAAVSGSWSGTTTYVILVFGALLLAGGYLLARSYREMRTAGAAVDG